MRHVLDVVAMVIGHGVVAVGHLEVDAVVLETNISELFFAFESACWTPQDWFSFKPVERFVKLNVREISLFALPQ